eukprot:350348-Chlamydomonas_euryale.AAC.1
MARDSQLGAHHSARALHILLRGYFHWVKLRRSPEVHTNSPVANFHWRGLLGKCRNLMGQRSRWSPTVPGASLVGLRRQTGQVPRSFLRTVIRTARLSNNRAQGSMGAMETFCKTAEA